MKAPYIIIGAVVLLLAGFLGFKFFKKKKQEAIVKSDTAAGLVAQAPSTSPQAPSPVARKKPSASSAAAKKTLAGKAAVGLTKFTKWLGKTGVADAAAIVAGAPPGSGSKATGRLSGITSFLSNIAK